MFILVLSCLLLYFYNPETRIYLPAYGSLCNECLAYTKEFQEIIRAENTTITQMVADVVCEKSISVDVCKTYVSKIINEWLKSIEKIKPAVVCEAACNTTTMVA